MQYLGGKYRLAKALSGVMVPRAEERSVYLEPFIGGGSTFAAMAPHFKRSVAADLNPDVALMWSAAVAGSWEPPEHMNEEEWRVWKNDPTPSPDRCFAGFACSFGGKWFAGYARGTSGPNAVAKDIEMGGRDFASVGRRSVLKKVKAMQQCPSVSIIHAPYTAFEPIIHEGCVIYCDPPYADTETYGAVEKFDSEAFWDRMRAWSATGARVFVSEFKAPDDFVPIWELERRITVDVSGDTTGRVAKRATDVLFVHESQA